MNSGSESNVNDAHDHDESFQDDSNDEDDL